MSKNDHVPNATQLFSLFRRRLRAPAVEVFQSQIKRDLAHLAQLIKPSAKQAIFAPVCWNTNSSKQHQHKLNTSEKRRLANGE